jgi:nucleoid-associated protein YgaU
MPLTNPTSGGRPGRARHLVTSDENLATIAQQAFGTPSAWRAIAEVNGIDDPSAIRPGDVVYLPAEDELAELASAST